MNRDRIVFFSSGDFGIDTFKYLIESGCNIVGLVTSIDNVEYHGKRIVEEASVYNIPSYIIRGNDMENDVWLDNFLDKAKGDIYCVISFKKLPEKIVRKAKKCAFNVHASLLPFLRGAAPINHAIRLGLKETGLTAFLLSDKIDCGDIIANDIVQIKDNETYNSLFQRLSKKCCDLTLNVISEILNKNDFKERAIKQPSFEMRNDLGLVYNNYLYVAPKITESYYKLPWDNQMSVSFASDLIRSVNGFNAQIVIYDKEKDEFISPIKCKIYDIETVYTKVLTNSDKSITESDGKTFLRQIFKDGYISIKKIQIAGKKIMEIDKFLNGFRYFGNDEKYKTYITHID